MISFDRSKVKPFVAGRPQQLAPPKMCPLLARKYSFYRTLARVAETVVADFSGVRDAKSRDST